MQNNDELFKIDENDNGTLVKEFLFKLLDKWYWFVLFGFFGAVCGYFLGAIIPASYRGESTLLVNEEVQTMGGAGLFDGADLMSGHHNIQNNIGILQSYTLNKQVLEILNWRVSLYRKGLFSDTELYEDAPFTVESQLGSKNICGIPLNITLLSDTTYMVEVETDKLTNIEGNQKEGSFGVPFKWGEFSFTLNPIEGAVIQNSLQGALSIESLWNRINGKSDNEYYFVFNELSSQTKLYMGKLNVSVEDKQSDLIKLTMEGNNQARLVDYLNELSWVYIQFGLREKNRTSENTVRFIDSQLEGIVDSLQLTGRSFTDFRSRNRVMDLSQEAGMIIERMEQLQSEKSMAELRLQYYRKLRDYLGDASHMKKVVAPSVVGVTDPALNALVLKLSGLYSKRKMLSYSVKEKNPSLIYVDREIQYARQSLEENLGNLMETAQIEVRSLNKRLGRVKYEMERLPRTEQEMINIKRKFDLNNELYTFLLKKRAEAAITKASNIPDSRILDPARIETVSLIGSKINQMILFGLLIGLAIPFLVIFIKDYFSDRIQSADEVEMASKLPLAGTIYHNGSGVDIPVAQFPFSNITESFRNLRTNLDYLLSQDNQKVIAIHSTIPKEGKSFASVNLASILAMNNKKVLLVGVDMRKPRLFKMLGVENENGLSSFLINQNIFEEIICETDIKNLSFVPSGPIPPNPAELLSNGVFEGFIKEARKQYDYIVMDNAPVSMVTDGLLAGRHADVNLFLLRQGYTPREQIKSINRIAEQGLIGQVAFVWNDVKDKGIKYGKKYGYYYKDS